MADYTAADRTIWVQRLPLTDAQAVTLAARLEHDARPENREYLYDHFMDNCTTRLRDIGVTEDMLPGFAEKTFAIKRLMRTNPRMPQSADEILAIYRAAF